MQKSLSHILFQLLHEARRQLVRLGKNEDAKALHDFRVCIRRLRVWIKILENYELLKLKRPERGALKKLVKMTNSTRDLEVHLEILKEIERASIKEPTLEISKAWSAELLIEKKRIGAKTGKFFKKADPALTREIHALEKKEDAVDLSEWLHNVFATYGKRLDQALTKINAINAKKKFHRARLDAKALRYLVEPFVVDNPDARRLVDDLRKLQNLIGSLRDAQAFAERLRRTSRSGFEVERILSENDRRMKVIFQKFKKHSPKSTDCNYERSALMCLA